VPSLTAALIASVLALAALASQTAPDDSQETRLRLETTRRELLATLRDRDWMADHNRATIARLQIEQYWKACAANEAIALATKSERPARVIAESALNACQPWQSALELALESGAYPYLEGPGAGGRISRDDMVMAARLESLDAAQARIAMWRGTARAPLADASPAVSRVDPRARILFKPAPIPERFAPAEPQVPTEPPAKAGPEEEAVIVVTGRLRGGCRVRLADRTLTEKELAAKARAWAASGTALKVVRPRGADYRCMAKIAWQLGRHGLRLFEFVEASKAGKAADPKREQQIR
jgi:hypothetical protein